MHEHHARRLLPRRLFYRRVIRHVLVAASALLVSLAIGTLGFHALAGQQWMDAFLDASMLLGGMGPIGTYDTAPGKLFAAFYALYAGVVFLGTVAFVMTPIVHRLLH